MRLPKLKPRTCNNCNAVCCKYITIELDTPETLDDFENIRWYIAHKNTEVNVEEDSSWWIKFHTPCKHLNKNNLCNIYKNRPKICKEHTTKSCEKYNKENFLLTFKSIKDIDNYIKNIFKKGKHTFSK